MLNFGVVGESIGLGASAGVALVTGVAGVAETMPAREEKAKQVEQRISL